MNKLNAMMHMLTCPPLIKEAREWINECQWGDLDIDDIKELPAGEVIVGINNHYVGGIVQFILDA